jgi:hypothetical protein
LYAGTQENSISDSCSQSEIIVVEVTLPMTKTVFLANQDAYISSVATTAKVTREKVQILSIDEVSTRSLRLIPARLLLATFVLVQTSVAIPAGKQTYIQDQAVLNSNLNKYGLPHGSLVVQTSSVANIIVPTSGPGGSKASSSNFSLGIVVQTSSVIIGPVLQTSSVANVVTATPGTPGPGGSEASISISTLGIVVGATVVGCILVGYVCFCTCLALRKKMAGPPPPPPTPPHPKHSLALLNLSFFFLHCY